MSIIYYKLQCENAEIMMQKIMVREGWISGGDLG